MKAILWTVLICVGVVISQVYHDLNYVCLHDGTLRVENPDTTKFHSASASAVNTSLVCNVTSIIGSSDTVTIFVVRGCPKETRIAFTISTRAANGSMGDGVIGGSSETYVVFCKELDAGGELFEANLGVTVVTPKLVTENESEPILSTLSPANVTFSISNAIYDENYAGTVNTANIGTLLKWHIKGPVEFDLLPIACLVYAGASVGGSVSKPLVVDGCTEDYTLISDFSEYGSAGGEIFSNFYAFQFVNYDYITLACTVRVCNGDAPACQQSCKPGRRRRATDPSYLRDIDRLRQLLKDEANPVQKEISPADIAMSNSYVFKSLRVAGFGSASCLNGGGRSLMFLCAIVSVMFWRSATRN